MTTQKAIVIDTPHGINMVRLAALKGALKLEVLGMKRRGQSVATIIKNEFGFKGNNKKVLAQLEDYIEKQK